MQVGMGVYRRRPPSAKLVVLMHVIIATSRFVQAGRAEARPPSWVSLRARRNDRFRSIDVPVAALKLSLQLHLEMSEVDQVPADKLPLTVLAQRVFKTGHEMHSVVQDLVRRRLRFEIKCAKTALAAPRGVE